MTRLSLMTSRGSPCAINWPWCSTTRRCEIESTTFIRCSITMMVTPRFAILRIIAERLGDLGRIKAGVDLVEHEKARLHGEALGKLKPLPPR